MHFFIQLMLFLHRIVFYGSLQDAASNFNARDFQDMSHVSGSDPIRGKSRGKAPHFVRDDGLTLPISGLRLTVGIPQKIWPFLCARFNGVPHRKFREIIVGGARSRSTSCSSSCFSTFYSPFSIKTGPRENHSCCFFAFALSRISCKSGRVLCAPNDLCLRPSSGPYDLKMRRNSPCYKYLNISVPRIQ